MSRRAITGLCFGLFLVAGGAALAQGSDPDDLLDGLPPAPSGLTACDVQLGPGMGSGAPGTGGHAVPLLLANTNSVASLSVDIVDTPDFLVATGCTSLMPGFVCSFVDTAGRVELALSSPSSATIPINLGARPVAEVLYSVAPGAPSGTIPLDPLDAVVVDGSGQSCTSTPIAGSFLVDRCGDGNVAGAEACDDGNVNDGDCCSSTCQIETCDDGSACTADSCVAGSGCLFDPAPLNGTPCGDPASGPCNNADVCFAGVCDPGLSPAGTLCGDMMSNACNAPDSCNASGVCSQNLAPAGTTCGDPTSTACNAPDSCNGAGGCLANFAPQGTPCGDPEDFCQATATCNAGGMCQPGSGSKDCSDDFECTVDDCDEVENECTHTPIHELCDDGLVCNGAETCDVLLGCREGTPVECPADELACTLDACVEPNGTCGHTPQDSLCSDGLFCNGEEVCNAVRGCGPGEPPCSADECDEASDSCGAPDNDSCLNAVPIAIGSVTPGTTSGATPDAAPLCGTSNTAPGVWYSVVGNGTTLTASTCETVGNPPGSADYDSKISVFCLDCTFPTCVGGNDDVAGCSFHSAVTWCAQAGVTYRVLLHGFGSATGNFTLGLSSNGTSCAATVGCLPPPPAGACCLTSAPPYDQGEVPISCQDQVGEDDCARIGGVYQGNDSTCVVAVNQIDEVVSPGLTIPDNAPVGVNSVLRVGASAIIADLNVDIGITHTWVSDLVIQITSPAGTTQVLWNQVCGSSDNINATADDSGTETFCAPVSAGPIDSVFFAPELTGKGPLSVFNGENALGNWTLNVSDHFAADFGTLNQWSLHILEGAPVCSPVTCPTGGGDGGGGGGGGEDDGDDEDEEGEDEEGDARWVLAAEPQASSTAPFALSERANAGEGAGGGPSVTNAEETGSTELLGWRSDGSEVLYRTLRPTRSLLVAVDPRTGAKRTVFEADVPGWFGGSGVERVLFGWRDAGTGRYALDLVDGSTGGVLPISRSACSAFATLHELSDRVAFVDCSVATRPAVRVRDLRSGLEETWAQLDERAWELSWSTDGSQLAAASTAGVLILGREGPVQPVSERDPGWRRRR